MRDDDADCPEEDAVAREGLTAEDLRDLATAFKGQDAASRQLPGLVDVLALERHDALLDCLELRINEVAKEIGS